MNYERLLLLVGVAAFSVGSTLATLAVIAVSGTLCRRLRGRGPRQRAFRLLALRTAPFAAGTICTVGIALAFIRYEPPQTTEEAGAVLLSLAGSAAVLAVVAAWRLAVAAARTAQCNRIVRLHGRPVDLPEFPLPAWQIPVDFPIAAISGVIRPRLILSSRVVEECDRDELLAVLRHERAHVVRRDNLARAFLIALPDVFGLLAGGRALVAAWHAAVEEAADDEAVKGNPAERVALASALVKVGRMAAGAPPAWMPALALLALFDGDDLECRVRRLLDPQPARETADGWSRHAAAVVGIASVLALGWAATGPRPLHDVMEWAVRNLP